MHQRIRLDTMNDIKKFIEVVSRIDVEVTLEDSEGHRVSAKSLLGAMYSMEWNAVYCCSQKDFSAAIMPWIL